MEDNEKENLFSESRQHIDLWVKVRFSVINLEKANKLKFAYTPQDKPSELVDEDGNVYSPLFVLENVITREVLITDKDFETQLGLEISKYHDSGISEPYRLSTLSISNSNET